MAFIEINEILIKELIENEKTTIKISKKTNIANSNSTIVPGMFFINDVVVRDNEGTSEVYVAAGSRLWDIGGNQSTILGSGHDAVYKSIDGVNWSKIELYHPIDNDNDIHNFAVVPMDLELDNDNRLWASSTISPQYRLTGDQWGGNPPKGGGKMFFMRRGEREKEKEEGKGKGKREREKGTGKGRGNRERGKG